MQDLKVGDKIRVISSGSIGEIAGKFTETEFHVQMDDGVIYAHADNLELLNPLDQYKKEDENYSKLLKAHGVKVESKKVHKRTPEEIQKENEEAFSDAKERFNRIQRDGLNDEDYVNIIKGLFSYEPKEEK